MVLLPVAFDTDDSIARCNCDEIDSKSAVVRDDRVLQRESQAGVDILLGAPQAGSLDSRRKSSRLRLR